MKLKNTNKNDNQIELLVRLLSALGERKRFGAKAAKIMSQ